MPYICGKCGLELKDEELSSIQGVRCRCGSRILYKARPPVTKKVLAR
ncbi:MAG: hypothetical protein QXW47_04685 [Candidatus Jordarchaeales archaeon]|nr:DNA-directed RNA polymerase subunit P [Candidatus Jordarchaeia archaeon]